VFGHSAHERDRNAVLLRLGDDRPPYRGVAVGFVVPKSFRRLSSSMSRK
jgi:hypothetical protein